MQKEDTGREMKQEQHLKEANVQIQKERAQERHTYNTTERKKETKSNNKEEAENNRKRKPTDNAMKERRTEMGLNNKLGGSEANGSCPRRVAAD